MPCAAFITECSTFSDEIWGLVWNVPEFMLSRIFMLNYGKFAANLLAFGLFIKMENRGQKIGRMTLFLDTIQLLNSWPSEPTTWLFSEKLFILQTSCRHKRHFKSTNFFLVVTDSCEELTVLSDKAVISFPKLSRRANNYIPNVSNNGPKFSPYIFWFPILSVSVFSRTPEKLELSVLKPYLRTPEYSRNTHWHFPLSKISLKSHTTTLGKASSRTSQAG